MAVVINEFEVAPQERGQQSSSSAAGSSSSAQPPKPEEVERAMRRQLERLARVQAH
ncbi:MAG: hypothetical protein AABO41_17050 [Acidobacteriota bacterium]